MFRFGCAAYSGLTVRHAPVFAPCSILLPQPTSLLFIPLFKAVVERRSELVEEHPVVFARIETHSFLQKINHFLLKINCEDDQREDSNLIRPACALP
jgi:hypothetical protein